MVDENDNNEEEYEPLQIMGSNLGSGINPYQIKPLTWLVTCLVFGTPVLLVIIIVGVIPQALFSSLIKIIEWLS